ncbi:MAG TPA: glycosyltransferase [Rhodanobacteraceae bacterium]|nr:glycosyltransferase [Rhodanobacteraceae bacterium]
MTTVLSRANGARRARAADTRKAILVLGMHRSGTSAVTRCLNLLGAEVGSKLLPPANDNRSGFWEHADVVAIHEELLADLGRVWHDARALPEGWLLSDAARKARGKLAGLIADEFDASALCVVKDPRLCRFVPLWREVLLEAGLDAVALLVVRHPAEVARSLNARDGLRCETTCLNWLEHFAEAETATRGMPRSLLAYDDLLADWRDVFAKAGKALQVEWPVPIEHAHPAVDAFLDRTKRHHAFSRDFCSTPEVLDRLYGLCRAFDPERQDWNEISRLVDAYRLIAPPLLDRLEHLFEEKRALEDNASRVEKAMETALGEIEEAAKAARSMPGLLQAGSRQRMEALEARGAELGRELTAARERAARVQRETFCVIAKSLELSNQLEAARIRSADLEAYCAQKNTLEFSLRHELEEIKASTLWRALVGVRSLLLRLPVNMRRMLRRAMRVAWWIVTPWRTLARWQFFREQRAAARLLSAGAVNPEPASTGGVPESAAGVEQGRSPSAHAAYTYSPPKTEPAAIGKALLALSRHSLFSVVVPVYNTDPALLRRMIASVEAQWYPHWELVLVDDHSTSPAVREVLGSLVDPRIVIVQIAENRGISGATNEGIVRATGDFIVFLDHDDELTVDCLYELALRIDRDDPDYLYSDEDKLDADGRFVEPFFKPDWSPDTLMSTMFTCHVSCVRRSLALELGGLRSEYDGSQDWDFVLRVSERARRIAHVAKVLYHWRITPESCASDIRAKPYAIDAGKRAREDALRRRGHSGELVPVPELPGYYRTRYRMQGQPLVSIMVPSKNNGAVLKACIDSIFEKTLYRLFEIVVINNGSTDECTLDYLSGLRAREQVRVLDCKVPFNYSEINNAGVRASRGELLVFLNDDTEVLSADWLETMGGYAQLPHVGAVGAKLLYPGARTVQHSGVLNLTNGPSHAFAHVDARAPGYFARNMLEHDWIAVTGACLMIERKKFDAVGGFDEDLAVTYNDTALCLSLAERGFHHVVCPGVELIHHESLSRGRDGLDRARVARGERERVIMFGKHPGFYDHDPFHNPNLAPNDAYFGLRQ